MIAGRRDLPGNSISVAATAATAADEAEVVFCSLPTPLIVEEVVLGADGLTSGFNRIVTLAAESYDRVEGGAING